ncbi:hypothetical protein [uncultured Psychroserpens sp.]|uniref:hypothetical protein n=1 Tax=uncultured Psychroserpens sp. TaxID=255436 RepID=UPI002629EA93|nr:hypothetical protein [uncultured Psychroserpens sp.]
MKTILFFILLCVSTVSNQKKPIDKWVQSVIDDLVEMNDLEKYSNVEIPSDVNINFIAIESVKDVTIVDDTINMLVDHGKGKYCTKLTFKYIEKNNRFYLKFSEVITRMTPLDTERKYINPWVSRSKVCD